MTTQTNPSVVLSPAGCIETDMHDCVQVVLRSLAESSLTALHSQGVGTQGSMTEALTGRPLQPAGGQPAAAAAGWEQQQRRMPRYARLPGRRVGRRAPPVVVVNSLAGGGQQLSRGPSRLSASTSVTGLQVGTHAGTGGRWPSRCLLRSCT